MQALTIVLGDYNFSAVFCQEYERDTGRYFITKTVQEKETTISKENAYYVSDYDHFSYDEEGFAATEIIYDRIDSVSKYLNNDFKKHWEDVSDHVPIRIELNLNPRR
jgi:endonuclease/exonuclease/phosphatase family metal-dependent hydrolase